MQGLFVFSTMSTVRSFWKYSYDHDRSGVFQSQSELCLVLLPFELVKETIKPCMKQELPKARKRRESYKNLWQIGISGENLQLGSGEVTMLGG